MGLEYKAKATLLQKGKRPTLSSAHSRSLQISSCDGVVALSLTPNRTVHDGSVVWKASTCNGQTERGDLSILVVNFDPARKIESPVGLDFDRRVMSPQECSTRANARSANNSTVRRSHLPLAHVEYPRASSVRPPSLAPASSRAVPHKFCPLNYKF